MILELPALQLHGSTATHPTRGLGLKPAHSLHLIVAMAVNFSTAFDTVDHIELLSSIHDSTMDANSITWLRTYLPASCS